MTIILCLSSYRLARAEGVFRRRSRRRSKRDGEVPENRHRHPGPRPGNRLGGLRGARGRGSSPRTREALASRPPALRPAAFNGWTCAGTKGGGSCPDKGSQRLPLRPARKLRRQGPKSPQMERRGASTLRQGCPRLEAQMSGANCDHLFVRRGPMVAPRGAPSPRHFCRRQLPGPLLPGATPRPSVAGGRLPRPVWPGTADRPRFGGVGNTVPPRRKEQGRWRTPALHQRTGDRKQTNENRERAAISTCHRRACPGDPAWAGTQPP
jgi:hypothetical protein